MVKDRTLQPSQVCRHRSLVYCAAVLGLLLVLVGLGDASIFAESPAVSGRAEGPAVRPTVPSPLRFRRVFVPQDRLNEVRDPQPYFPVNAAEFEQMISRANNQSLLREQNGLVASAMYLAVVRNEQLVGLEGEWLIQLPDQVTQAFIPLGTVNIAISDVTWADTGGISVPLLTDGEGRLGLLVDRSGKVRFRWSAQHAAMTSDRGLRFRLQFPQALENQLGLVLADHWQIDAENTLILPGAGPAGELPGYRLVFHSDQPIVFTLERHDWQQRNLPRLIYSEKAIYELTLQGIEANWEWDVGVLDDQVNTLRFPLPPGFQLTEARLGDSLIPWKITAQDDAGPSRVELLLPEGLRGYHRRLTLRGLRTLPLDRPLALAPPSLDEAFWMSGTTTLIIRHPLALKDLQLQAARLREVVNLPSAPADTALEIVNHAPESVVQLICALAPPELSATAFINWVFDRDRVRSQVNLALQNRGGDVFELRLPVEKGWRLDDLSTLPEGLVESWQVNTSETEGRGEIVLRLRRALPQETVSVLRLAMSRPTAGPPLELPLSELLPIVLPGAHNRKIYGTMRTASALAASYLVEVQPSCPPATQAALESLSQWVSLPSGLTVWEIPNSGRAIHVRMLPRPRRLLAQMQGLLITGTDRLSIRYEVTVQPEQGDVDRLRIVWTQPAESAPGTWLLRQKDGGEIRLNVVAVPNSRPGDVPEWDILLPQATAEPFTLVGELEIPLQPGPVPLLLPVEALRFDATIRVGHHPVAGAQPCFRWISRGLRIVNEDHTSPSTSLATFATYRYEGGTSLERIALPQLSLTDEAGRPVSPLWATRGEVLYRLDGAGLMERWHTFLTTAPHGGEAVFARGEDADPLEMSVTFDGKLISWTTLGDGSVRGFKVSLPPHSTQGLLVIWERFAGPAGPVARVKGLHRLSPQFPVVQWTGTVWTPPGYWTLSADDLLDWGVHIPAWGSRLFGPLWRPSDQPLFLPDRLNRWLFDPAAPPPNLAVRRAEQFLEVLGETLQTLAKPATKEASVSPEAGTPAGAASSDRAVAAPADAAPSPSLPAWRDVLSDALVDRVYSLPPGTRAVIFLIDTQAFEELGITPLRPWPSNIDFQLSNDSELPRDRAILALDRAGLVLVLTPRAVVLTSLTQVARHRRVITWSQHPLYKIDPESPWCREILDALAREGGEHYCRIRLWNDLPEPAPTPAHLPQGEPALTFARQGWNARVLPADSLQINGEVMALLVPGDQILGARWVVTLLVTLLGAFFTHRRRGLLLVALTAAVLVVFVPWPAVPAVSGVFLGSALALLFSLLRADSLRLDQSSLGQPVTPEGPGSPATAVRDQIPNRPVTSRAGIVRFGVIVLLVGLGSHFLYGESVPPSGPATQVQPSLSEPRSAQPSTTPAAAPTYRVFIPVDEKGQPVGQEIYVPSDFYRELQRLLNPPSVALPGPQFVSAVYRGTLASSSSGERWGVSDFNLTLECLIPDGPIDLEFPLGSDLFKPRLEELLLDGRPAAANWTGGRLRLRIADPGRHRVRIPFTLAPLARGTTLELSGAIPPVVNARLELLSSSEFLRVEVPSALGRVESDPESGTWTAELGPAEQLVIRWPASQAPFTESLAECEKLSLLDAQPDGFRWIVKWRLRTGDTQAAQLQLVCDPDLVLAGVSGPGQVTVQPRQAGADLQLFDLTFNPPLPKEAVLTTEFLQSSGEGPGGVRLPFISLKDFQVNRQNILITRMPNWDIVIADAPGWSAVDVLDVATRWELTSLENALAYETRRASAFWGAWFIPQPVTLSCEEIYQLTVQEDAVHIAWQARFGKDQRLPGCFQLLLPAGLHLERLALYSGAAEQRIHFLQPEPGTLLVLAGTLPAGETRLIVEGTVSKQAGQEWSLPRIQVRNTFSQSLTVSIFREANVAVEVTEASNLESITLPSGSLLYPADDLQVAAFSSLKPEAVSLKLRSLVQESLLEGTAAVRIYPEKDRWLAEVAWDLALPATGLREIPLEWSAEWRTPTLVSPQGTLRVKTNGPASPATEGWTTTNGFTVGVLSFATSQSGQVCVTLRGELQPDSRGQLKAPLLRSPLISCKVMQIFLPISVAWDQTAALLWGLRPMSDQELQSQGLSEKEWRGYEATPPFRWPVVVLPETGPGQMDALEMLIAVNPQGELFGWLSAELVGGPAGEIRSQPLPGLTPVAAWLDGRLVPTCLSPKGEWIIPLDDGPTHRLLEVLFFQERIERPSISIILPQFVDFSAPQQSAFWLQMPLMYRAFIPGASAVNLRDFELARVRRLAERLTALASRQTEDLFGEKLRVARRFLWLRDRTQREIMLSPPGGGANSAEIRLRNLEFQVTDFLQSLLGVEATSLTPGERTAETITAQVLPSDLTRQAFLGDQPPEKIVLEAQRPSLPGWEIGLSVLIILAGAAVAMVTLSIWNRSLFWLMRFPHPVMVMAGLLWWLYLRPSFVGWLLVLAALLLLIRSRWEWVPQEEAEVPLIVHQPVESETRSRSD